MVAVLPSQSFLAGTPNAGYSRYQPPTGAGGLPLISSLGVLNALEPNLEQLMLPFTRLNPDPETLIEVLGLNFDPDVALGISSSEVAPPAIASVPTVIARPAQATPVVPPTPSAAPAAVPAATAPPADNSNVLGGYRLSSSRSCRSCRSRGSNFCTDLHLMRNH